MNLQLLVVDDDKAIADALRFILPSSWCLRHFLNDNFPDEAGNAHAAFIDMHLSSTKDSKDPPDGLRLIRKLIQINSKIEIIAMSGDLSLSLMETCLKEGASRFLSKPLLPDEVISCLDKIEALWQIRHLESHIHGPHYRWVGDCKLSEEVKRKTARLKGEVGPILIEGETGTGKEVVFHLLNSQELNRPTVTVNIAAIPESLFESELFGYVKGAFTGAEHLKIGLAEAAHGGDLFLDEIEALPLSQQVKLLRFLETGEVRKIGSKEPTHIKTRVIAASNKNLFTLVKDGKFREDLFFRLSGTRVFLPPLRDRKEDIPELARYFLSLQKPRRSKTFSSEALDEMMAYSWPGNVRELKRVCEQLHLIAPLPIIRSADVKPFFASSVEPSSRESVEGVSESHLNFEMGLVRLTRDYEAHLIRTFLHKEPDVEKAAKVLKVSRSSLYKKIKHHHIQSK